MRTRVVVVLLLTCTGLAVGPMAAAEAAPLCLGKTATIVAGPEQRRVVGTDGPDVIVALASRADVHARGGDDSICVSDGRVIAGDGNDAVLATTPVRNPTVADLGPGDDSYLGGPGSDTVDTGSASGAEASDGADVIATGGGSDQVRSGGYPDPDGAPGEPNRDQVDLGAGRNSIYLSLPPGSDAQVFSGPGASNDLVFQSVGGSLAFDLAAGLVSRDGLRVARLGRFSYLQLDLAGQGSVALLGTAHGDRVQTFAAGVSASLAGGRDTLSVAMPRRTATSNEVDGGPGRDSLGFVAESAALEADLEAGWLRLVTRRASNDFVVSGIENIGAHVSRARVHGDGHRNVLVTTGCPARLDGAGGPDVLVYNRDGNCGAVLKGGPGRDRLVGGIGNDRLIGGPGYDFARGWTGQDDVCRAEVEVECDR